MNERIKELSLQASDSIPDDVGAEHAMYLFQKKFAELIVRECTNILDPNGEYTEKYKHSHTPGPDGLRTVLSQEQYFEMLASEKLKKHFGVE